MDCEWDESLTCVHCGYIARVPGTKRRCKVVRPVVEKLSRYGDALARWITAGAPTRTQQQIDDILARHCRTCVKYVDGVCGSCGCPVNRSSGAWAFRNKLAMATESCPLNPPAWTADHQSSQRKALRVGFVLPCLKFGGVERWHLALIRALRRHEDIEPIGVAVTGLPEDIDRRVVDEMATLCPVMGLTGARHHMRSRHEGVAVLAAAADVIVVWSIGGRGLDILAASARPLIGVSHGCGDWWMREADPHIAQWVAVSEAAAFPCPRQATVIDNGVELDRLTPTRSREAVRIDAGIPRDARVVVSIGRLSREKRLPLLAIAMDRLPPDVWLWLVGDGPAVEVERIKSASGAAGNRLVITPARQDVGNVLGASDCFAFASEAEGYGLAPVEALAAGVPLVATRVGILPQLGDVAEWIGQDPTAGEVADAILAVLPRVANDGTTRDEAVIQRLYAYRHIVHRVHSAGAMAERWARFLKEVARVRPAAGAPD